MAFEVTVWQNDGFKVQNILLNRLGNLLDSMLARLVFSLNGDHNPIVKNVEHLESLARDFMKDQSCPREEQIESHREVLALHVEYIEDLLVK